MTVTFVIIFSWILARAVGLELKFYAPALAPSPDI